ncbi:MAG: TonB family protein [Chloracidobacterium sp.]|nr:TonB family protein [Chloracidobacterium sp.]
MPLNVRRFCTSVFLVLGILIVGSHAQTVAQQTTNVAPPPTSGDVMRDRISKAKAFIAVRNYAAASYELENIRKETSDAAVQSVVSVLLMNSYLEQGDYKRAQDFLNEYFNLQKTTKPNASANYMAVAGQVVKNARDRAERYRALGISVSDRTLPLEALNDLEKMRETLEIVVTQSKEIGKSPIRTADAMALLEEATNSRSILARDDYDSRRWKDEVTDTRETMANARSVVLDAADGKPVVSVPTELVAAKTASPGTTPPVAQTVAMREREVKTPEKTSVESTVADNEKPIYIPSPPATVKPTSPAPKKEPPATVIAAGPAPVPNDGPLEIGSLLEFATDRVSPTYPPLAKTQRMTGIVRVDLTINEKGEVDEVQKLSGPFMLQGAARQAIKKWRFKPFTRDGQPVKAIGYVSFNFDL